MAKITMTEQPEWDVLPPDTIVKLKIAEAKIEDLEGKYGPWQKMSVKFEILDTTEEYSGLVGSNIWGSVPFKLTDSPDNQLRQWVEAILGFPLSVGFELDTDDLEGKRCRGIVSNYTSKKDQKPRHQIESLLPWIAGDATDSKPRQQQSNEWNTPPAQQQPPAQPVGVSAMQAPQDEEIPF